MLCCFVFLLFCVALPFFLSISWMIKKVMLTPPTLPQVLYGHNIFFLFFTSVGALFPNVICARGVGQGCSFAAPPPSITSCEEGKGEGLRSEIMMVIICICHVFQNDISSTHISILQRLWWVWRRHSTRSQRMWVW